MCNRLAGRRQSVFGRQLLQAWESFHEGRTGGPFDYARNGAKAVATVTALGIPALMMIMAAFVVMQPERWMLR